MGKPGFRGPRRIRLERLTLAAVADSRRSPFVARAMPQVVLLCIVAAATAAWTVVEADGMWNMPGTMGYSFGAFVAMWTLMMTAMMLPSVIPFASMYSRTVTDARTPRLTGFAAGYLLVWTLAGIPAYTLAWIAGEYAGESTGTVLAVAVFAAGELYQLTPLKYRCLSHCRSAFGHVLHYTSLSGPLRDLRAGFGHGAYCLACCWGLMLLLIAFGVMNVPAMILLASVVAAEKFWRWGEVASRTVGVVAVAAAVVVIWVPELAPGLTNSPMDMSMDGVGAMNISEG